jgi:catechol 2,3-dioxygenase-like lactoylglutathione lyase family enzyme
MVDSAPHETGVAFGRIAAAIPVSDISRALGFYQDILGMSVAFTNGDPVGFVFADPDGNRIDVGQRMPPGS